MVEPQWLVQAGGFLLAGAASAVVDFGLFNLLAGWCRWRRVAANLVSTSLAMMVSFVLNQRVFDGGNAAGAASIPRFLVVTLCSALLLQNVVLAIASRELSARSRWPDWTQRNLAKGLAVGTGLVWNFLWYRFWVFG